jgi:ATP-dependent DNA helicase
MLQQMAHEEDIDAAKDERSRKKAAKLEEKGEPVSAESQRRTTRVTLKTTNDTTSSPKLARGRLKKAESAQTKLSTYFSKADVQAKAGAGSITETLHDSVDDGVKTSDVGIQNLKSAYQPSLVTGGTMRKYQLEGLEWLKSLYENGLNGILADEMGLGKTIQTIAFLAFLREMETYGPFLIAAPLSTTTNWVDEFRKWTPTIPVVLYHGSKDDRANIRNTRFNSPGAAAFPVVITTYEICMNDRKHLANFAWKFIIIVSIDLRVYISLTTSRTKGIVSKMLTVD